jgi:hypothetical protein
MFVDGNSPTPAVTCDVFRGSLVANGTLPLSAAQFLCDLLVLPSLQMNCAPLQRAIPPFLPEHGVFAALLASGNSRAAAKMSVKAGVMFRNFMAIFLYSVISALFAIHAHSSYKRVLDCSQYQYSNRLKQFRLALRLRAFPKLEDHREFQRLFFAYRQDKYIF